MSLLSVFVFSPQKSRDGAEEEAGRGGEEEKRGGGEAIAGGCLSAGRLQTEASS